MASARVAILGTIGADGRPHLVPFTFALEGDVLYSAVDRKPKTTRALTRLANIHRDPRVCVLVESYDDEWSRLWWCRLDGSARVLDKGADVDHARELLTAKYSQYAAAPFDGPLIVVSIGALTGWAAST